MPLFAARSDSAIIIKKELKELLFFLFPIAFIIFFNQLFLFAEKIFLARISIQVMEAAVAVGYLAQIFQGALVAMAMMAQVYVGRKHGSGEWNLIGPNIWQWIWFAVLSMLVSVPGNIIYGRYYLDGTEIEAVAWPYFYSIISIGFLYPLAAVLSCFFLGQRKRTLVFLGSLACHVIKLGLAYLLIFGWEPWIPAFGLLGGVIAAFIAQGGLCCLLLTVFLNQTNAAAFNTRDWRLRPRLFYKSIHPGLMRACNRILSFTCWIAIAHLMTSKGGDYLLILSIGGTLSLISQFIGDAMNQAQTILVARLIGAREDLRLEPAFISGFITTSAAALLIAIPLLLFPQYTFHWLFPAISLDPATITRISWGVWLSSTFFTYTSVPVGYILAFHDMRFSVIMGWLSWLYGYLWMYWMIEVLEIGPDLFWLALCVMHLVNGGGYLWRARVLCNRNQLSPAYL